MSYTVLARRYRSGTFDEVIGQEHVAQTLKKAIASDRVAHAYLFCGTRGVGKTSMARILAKALNCRSSDQPTPEPCNKCDSCLAIARGEDMDVIEIDAASHTGVDNVRDIIISTSNNCPARSRFKVFIIDEVHMLSKSAFNALLKTLEEPPSHVKFILATTETEKVLPTILSRCQRYDFRNIPTREIAGHLKDICKKEKIKADDDALMLVAKAGAGSMRDALSLLDRLLSIGEKQLTTGMIEQLLGLPKSQLLFDLAQAIGDGDVKAVLSRADAMVTSGLSVDGLISALTDHLRNLLVLRTCGSDSDLVEVPGLPLEDLAGQAERFDPVALTQDVVILEELRRHVRQSQAGRALLDATLVRMALADQFASVGELLSRLDGGGAGGDGAQKARPAGSGRAPQLPVKSPAQAPLRSQPSPPPAPAPAQKKKPDEAVARPEPEPVVAVEARVAVVAPVAIPADVQDADADDDLPRPGKVWDGPSLKSLIEQERKRVVEPEAPAAAAPSDSNVEPVSADDLQGVWKALLQLMATQAQGLHGLLSHGRLARISDGLAVIRYGPQHGTFVKMLEKNGKKEVVRDAIGQVLKQSVGVKFEVEEEGAERTRADTVVAEATRPTGVDRNLGARGNGQAVSAPAHVPVPAPPQATARVTPEVVAELREKQPLVRALMDGLGAQIIKVE